jgi:hypothetical protein
MLCVMVMTITDFARLGGNARAKKLSKARRSEIGKLGAEEARRLGKLTGRPPNRPK